tara:strand:- start:3956 stop:4810 length:855 start_codon:yes stop_codon:yes gene_type:complete
MVELNGISLTNKLMNNLKTKLKESSKIINFTCISIGNDPASEVYINNKKKQCELIGIHFNLIKLESNVSETFLIQKICEINNNTNINAYIIQLPLPKHINKENIVKFIDPKKDVDCFHAENIGNIILQKPRFFPATPYGICLLLDNYNIETKGKNITIIGKSNIVGNLLSLMLSNENTYKGTVTTCDKYTENLKFHVENAEILIVAAGVHHLIDSKYTVKSSCTMIDVGIHRIQDNSKKNGFRLEGDIDFNYFKDKCKYITPVPGGVGPMTVYSLLYNIINSVL